MRPTASSALAKVNEIHSDQISHQLELMTTATQQQHQSHEGDPIKPHNRLGQPDLGPHNPQGIFSSASTTMHGGMKGQQQVGSHLGLQQGNPALSPDILNLVAPSGPPPRLRNVQQVIEHGQAAQFLQNIHPQRMARQPGVVGAVSANGQQVGFSADRLPPAHVSKFQGAYTTFCNQRQITHDKRLMEIDYRPVDLYRLHVEVMREGGRDQASSVLVSSRYLDLILLSGRA
jgi:hypothetical protein